MWSFLFTILILFSSTFLMPIYGEEQKIPSWIRNIFIWYGQNQISEDDLINAIKYLIENKIIQIDSDVKQIWVPKPGTTWNWQLDTPVVISYAVDMYDIDLFDNDAEIVNNIHSKGAKAICYISVGSWEDWRPDAKTFPSSIKGNDYDGWAGEKWLDIRALDVIGPIIEKRLDMCKEKGFDGVEPDNIDVYTNDSGFPLTYEDQLKFNIWLANKAHERGLSIGLKNNDEQVKDLIKYFDWALTEDCFVDEFCSEFEPFIKNGKAVFQAEYTDTDVTTDEFCPQSKTLQFSGILKDRELDAAFTSCN